MLKVTVHAGGLNERNTVTAMATLYASSESVIMSDEDPAYATFKRLFAGHQTVSHSKAFSLPDGTNNNQAESFNRRVRRAIEGVYLSASRSGGRTRADYPLGRS